MEPFNKVKPCLLVTTTTVSIFLAVLVSYSQAMQADLYLNKDKFGEFFKLEISEKGCTNVPLNWDNQAMSLDTHGSCIKFYDYPYCRGKYVALQPYHGTFQDNLENLGFNRTISSASPCGPKVPTGRYYIQNGADGSVLSIDMKNNTPVLRTHPFKPYIAKNQQYQIEKVSLADYEVIPRVQQSLNPLTYDMSISTKLHPVRRVWKIESVYRGRYVIKNEWNNRCLYKSDSGKVEEHECVTWSPNQEWIFRSIKVKPYFPSKEDLKKKPILPDSNVPFEPQDDAFSSIPYQPDTAPYKNTKGVYGLLQGGSLSSSGGSKGGKHPVQIQRPGPLVINPGEPFPPVFPFPVLPKVSSLSGKKPEQKPPVPHVRHPGPLPFPAEPTILDPNRPTHSPLDLLLSPQFLNALNQTSTTPASTKKKKDEDEDDSSAEDDEDRDDPHREQRSGEEEQDDLSDESNEDDRRGPPPKRGHHRHPPPPPPEDDLEGPPPPPEYDDYGPPLEDDHHHGPPPPPHHPQNDYHGHGHGPYPDYDYGIPEHEARRRNKIRQKEQKKQEAASGVKYSDYRLWF